MKTNGFVISIPCILFALTACQKEIRYTDFDNPVYDSLTVLKSVQTTNYNKDSVFLWKTTEVYDYEDKDHRITIDYRDSTTQGVAVYQEIFSYDNNQLTSFQTTNPARYYTRIAFQYLANGNLDKAIYYLTTGETRENNFTYSNVNNNTVITMYDTVKLGVKYTAYRPQVIKYTFNASNQLVRQLESETGPNKTPENALRDTFDYRFNYDAASNVKSMTVDYSFVSNSINTPFLRDSVAFTRESKGKELSDLYQNIYKNLYWFAFSEYPNNSFANAMVHNSFYPNYVYYLRNAMQRIDYWNAISEPTYTRLQTGIFQNVFNSSGQLIRAVYPRPFANQYDGREELEYTYVRVRK